MQLALAGRLRSDPLLQLALVVAGWAVTRFAVLILTLARGGIYPAQDNAFEMAYFESWGPAFARGEGSVPLRDGPWEYPAAAAVFIVFPSLLRGAPYVPAFIGQVVLLDLVLLGLLFFWGLRRGSLAGTWMWVLAVPLLGPVALGRFDVVPTLCAAGGLVAGAAAAPFTAGVLLATGASVKLWPALIGIILLILRSCRLRLIAGGAVVAAAVLSLLAWYDASDEALSFLRYQRERGLEVEAVPALPLMLQRLDEPERWPITFGYGSWQVDGPGAEMLLRVADLGLLGVALLVTLLTFRARRAPDLGQAAAVLAVALMSGFLLFDKVLSAQYPLWIAGLVAVALCWAGSPLRPLVPGLCGVLLLTQLVYPLNFQDLLAGDVLPVRLLLARDALLVLVFLQACFAGWRLGRRDAAAAETVDRPRQHQSAGSSASAPPG